MSWFAVRSSKPMDSQHQTVWVGRRSELPRRVVADREIMQGLLHSLRIIGGAFHLEHLSEKHRRDGWMCLDDMLCINFKFRSCSTDVWGRICFYTQTCIMSFNISTLINLWLCMFFLYLFWHKTVAVFLAIALYCLVCTQLSDFRTLWRLRRVIIVNPACHCGVWKRCMFE